MLAAPALPVVAEAFNTHHLVRVPGPSMPPSPPRGPRLAPAQWAEIAARAEHERLRDLAVAYGVSHETIRAIVRRVSARAVAAAPTAGEGLVAAHAMARAATTGGAAPALARPSCPRPGRSRRALGLAARR